MKYTAKDTESIVDVAFNTSGSLTALPDIIAALPAGDRIGFADEAWDGREIDAWGQSWTPDVRNVEIDVDVPIYNELALRKARFDSPFNAMNAANDWGIQALEDLNKVQILYTLDFATPFSVSVLVERGTYVTFPTPEELGFTIDEGYTFNAWTYLGQDVFGMIANNDLVIEGDINETPPRPNLIRGTRYFNPSMVQSSAVSQGFAFTGDTCLLYVSPQYYGEYEVDGGIEFVRLVRQRSETGVVGRLLYSVYPRVTDGALRRYVLSFVLKPTNASSSYNTVVYLDAVGSGNTNYPTATKAFIDGVDISSLVSGRSVSMGLLVMTPDVNHVIEVVFDSVGFSGNVMAGLPGIYVAIGTAISRIKIEDVTGLSENQQRATAWVPHVND